MERTISVTAPEIVSLMTRLGQVDKYHRVMRALDLGGGQRFFMMPGRLFACS